MRKESLTAARRNPDGWLLYATAEESEKNKSYIRMYHEAALKYGLEISLKIAGDTGELQAALSAEGTPDFAVNRTRDYKIAEDLEGLGVPVFNCARTAEYGNDKAKAYRYVSSSGIEIMPTVFDADTPPSGYPAVVKPADGHGGADVYLLENEGEWQQWRALHKKPGRSYVLQQAASDLGRDLRVYVVGNRITASVLRISDSGFRSNYSLGGRAVLYSLTGEQRRLAGQVMELFDIGMAGIDFVFHEGRLVFNELEDMAGARMLYSLTDYDIVDEYVRCIADALPQDMDVKRGGRGRPEKSEP